MWTTKKKVSKFYRQNWGNWCQSYNQRKLNKPNEDHCIDVKVEHLNNRQVEHWIYTNDNNNNSKRCIV